MRWYDIVFLRSNVWAHLTNKRERIKIEIRQIYLYRGELFFFVLVLFLLFPCIFFCFTESIVKSSPFLFRKLLSCSVFRLCSAFWVSIFLSVWTVFYFQSVVPISCVTNKCNIVNILPLTLFEETKFLAKSVM